MRVISAKKDKRYIQDGQIHIMHLHSKGDDRAHRHDFFELVYVLGGYADHFLDDETVPLRPGDYFIVDPGMVHCYRNTRQFEIINCLFFPEYIDRALKDCPSMSSLLSNQALHFGVPVDLRTADRSFHDDGTVRRLILAMEQEYKDKKVGCMESLRCYLTLALVCAVRASKEAERQRFTHDATNLISRYLREHYAAALSLDTLSAIVGYTPQYLSNLFRKDTGMSIREFLQRIRVEEACRLLKETDERITDIAIRVGYSNVKHFTGVFHRYKGICPRDYRRNNE